MSQWDDYKKTMIREHDLWSAAKEGEVDILLSLLKRGDAINAKDHRGYSPLMLGAYGGQMQAVQTLIGQGADVNSTDAAGNSILMGVCFKGNLDMVKVLLEAGASIGLRNSGGMSAYDIASTFGRTEVLQYLSTQGAESKGSNRFVNFFKLVASRIRGKLRI